jgi:DNA-binding NarL/FixJ family response regulator
LAQGASNRQIAEALMITENTVKTHVRNILEKLELHSRSEVAAYARRHSSTP